MGALRSVERFADRVFTGPDELDALLQDGRGSRPHVAEGVRDLPLALEFGYCLGQIRIEPLLLKWYREAVYRVLYRLARVDHTLHWYPQGANVFRVSARDQASGKRTVGAVFQL